MPLGLKMSDEAKAKMRAAKLGVCRKPFTGETIERMRQAQLGKTLSDETKTQFSKLT